MCREQNNEEKDEREIQKWMCASLLRGNLMYVAYRRNPFLVDRVSICPKHSVLILEGHILSFTSARRTHNFIDNCLLRNVYVVTQKSCAVGMRNAILRNNLNLIARYQTETSKNYFRLSDNHKYSMLGEQATV